MGKIFIFIIYFGVCFLAQLQAQDNFLFSDLKYLKGHSLIVKELLFDLNSKGKMPVFRLGIPPGAARLGPNVVAAGEFLERENVVIIHPLFTEIADDGLRCSLLLRTLVHELWHARNRLLKNEFKLAEELEANLIAARAQKDGFGGILHCQNDGWQANKSKVIRDLHHDACADLRLLDDPTAMDIAVAQAYGKMGY